MNKTVLLACCDFLILATLALTPAYISQNNEQESLQLTESDEFQIENSQEFDSDLSQSISDLKIDKLTGKLTDSQKALEAEKEKNRLQKQEIARLTKALNARKNTIHTALQNNRWQALISMKEDDSFRPDTFKTDFFTSSFKHQGKVYFAAEFTKLGFHWSEIVNDGNISLLKLTIAKTGNNPLSKNINSAVYSMTQDPGLCLIPVPKELQNDALSLLDHSEVKHSLESLYAAKCDGRIIKIKNASIIPNEPNWVTVIEERFLGHPDKLSKGDLLMDSRGRLIGVVTQSRKSGNSTVFKTHILSKLDFNEFETIPLFRKDKQDYFEDFVSKSRQISRKILAAQQ